MDQAIIKAVIAMLRATLGSMPAREADKIVAAAVDVLETQVIK